MNKNKITALLGAGVLTLGIVGGTLAWFTSQDDITNVFNTGKVSDPTDGENAGIDLNENFLHPGEDGKVDVVYDKDTDKWVTVEGNNPVTYDPTDGWKDEAGNKVVIDDVPGINKGEETGNKVVEIAKPVTPGTALTKEVEVENTTDYPQLVRAKVVKYFTDEAGNIVTHYYTAADGSIKYGTGTETDSKALDLSMIVLAENLYGTGSPTGWKIQDNALNTSSNSKTNYYYYASVLYPGAVTTDILKSVTLSGNAGNVYKNLKFQVKVEAESVQATNNAVDSVWKEAPEAIKELDLSK